MIDIDRPILESAVRDYVDEHSDDLSDDLFPEAGPPRWRLLPSAAVVVHDHEVLEDGMIIALVEFEVEAKPTTDEANPYEGLRDSFRTEIRIWMHGSRVTDVAAISYSVAWR